MFRSYTEDHGGKFNPGWEVGETELWMNALRPYYGDCWPLLLCPTATKLDDFYAPSTFAAWMRDVDLPGGGEHRYVSSYGINSWTNAVTHNRGSRLASSFWKTTEGVERPDQVPVFGDGLWHDSWPRATDNPMVASVDSGGAFAGAVGEMNHFCIDRHGGGVNMLFMDWSVRKVGLKELWALKWHRDYDTYGPWTRAGGVAASDWPEWMREFKDY
jgi:prepilin-type processing-associated H-X9-DG protein